MPGGGIPPQHAALELKITFKEGGAFDFSAKYEQVKERLQQAVDVARESGHVTGDGSETGDGRGGGALSQVNMDSVHLDELPAYEAPGRGHTLETGQPVTTTTRSQGGEAAPSGVGQPASQTFTPPVEPPPGYEEVQMDSIADELERRLRRDS